MSEPRITWLVDSLGYDNHLLYWNPLLRRYFDRFPATRVLSCETEALVSECDLEVERCLVFAAGKVGSWQIRIPNPFALVRVLARNPKLLVLSEFGLATCMGVLYRLLRPKTKVLLLVENDPAYLVGYRKNRASRWFALQRSLCAKLADVVLTNNTAGRQYLVNGLGVPDHKIIRRVYLTSTTTSRRASSEEPQAKLRILYVGRLTDRKGVDYLLRAVAGLDASELDVVTICIVGSGPELDKLSLFARELGLSALVRFAGFIEYERVGAFFSDADLFVLPTLADYRALVGFEALSAGLAIVDSRFDGACNEIVEEGVNGFIVDPTDVPSFTTALRFFIENPLELERFCRESYNRAQGFSADEAASSLIDASLRCLGTHSRDNEKGCATATFKIARGRPTRGRGRGKSSSDVNLVAPG